MQKKMHLLLRTLQYGGLLIIILTLTYQLIMLRNSANNIRQQQTEKFSYSLTNLAGSEAVRHLLAHKDKELQLLIDDLSHDPMVRDATLYNQFGRVLYHSKKSLSLTKLLDLDNQATNTSGLMPYVIELYNDGQKLGYLRITLEQDKILNVFHAYQETNLKILIIVLFLAFFGGVIMMALFFKQVENYYFRIQSGVQKLISQNQFL
ncbi:hypothetical protein PCNPT3_07155 [Psychromonas sp. CNPT3]|uniref:AhpA/YtjB family protein n=1 Tax=Psychromonas sp. CNPT3 TaxID=314282 RepID=UPI0002C09688|nr:AhpA/YtjB family protein [Psychromonas sp. CNPT3]AGH81369.1 hypothetical protein PCNPT3_07155 [Psychromonas sp. CNPT3]